MGEGYLYIIGIGPGGLEDMTGRARRAIGSSEVVVGYRTYVNLIKDLVRGKEVVATGMGDEVDRCRRAIELALSGRRVGLVSSGDPGIYGMTGLALELLGKDGRDLAIEVIPGVPAFCAAASLLGAPLMHDFAVISLSDLLTPWESIVERIEGAAAADFVIVLYNPKSKGRKEHLSRALEVIGKYRSYRTPVGIVKDATREGEVVIFTTLGEVNRYYGVVDMTTTLIVGSSTTFTYGRWMITPRGYRV